MPDARKILRLKIVGRVQGVGFRAFVADEAEGRGIEGLVRNRADGSVEALIAGEPDAVAAFVEALRRGPRGARVERVDIADANASDLAAQSKGTGFAILPTL
jgi:acylphosphatase